MTRVSISQDEFKNIVDDGVDLAAYFEGRFAEALHRGDLPTPVNIPLFLDGTKIAALESSVTYLETTHVANYEFDTLKREVELLKDQVTTLNLTNEAVFKRLCDLEDWKASMLKRLAKEAQGISPNDFTE